MADWEDAFGFAPPKVADFSGYAANQQQKQFRAQLAVGGGYNPYAGAPSNWLTALSAKKGYQPPAFPVGLNVTEPWSSRSEKPPIPQKDTTGDFFGSLGASFNNAIGQGGYLNLANGIPWAEERFLVAARELARNVEGTGSPTAGHIDAFAGVVKAVAEPVAASLNWAPGVLRDSQLNYRLETYRDLVLGRDPSGVGVTSLLMQTLPGFKLATAGTNLTPEQRAEKQALIAKMIDLPDSVKRQIEEDPNGDLTKYLDSAPEGRRLSYAPLSFGQAATELVGTGAVYALMMMGTGGLSALLRGPALMAEAPSLATATVGGSAAQLALRGAQAVAASRPAVLAAKGLTVFAQAQKVALASGISIFGGTVLVDAVLRTMGDKDGVAYLDHINRTALISDSPAVQLVSAFTVNPIAGARAAAKGELLMLRAPSILIDKALGTRLSRLYTHETYVYDRLADLYLTDRAGAEAMIGPGLTFETKGEAFDHIIGLAANSFADKLAVGDKTLINSLPIPDQTRFLLTHYHKLLGAELKNFSGAVAQFRSDWSYHDLYGQFDPEVAKIITRDNRTAWTKTAEARARTDTVPGYVDLLNPEGQAQVASRIEEMFADGRQGTLRDLNTLSVEHPSLNGLVKDLVAKGPNGKPLTKPGDLVGRDVFDTALARATDGYATRLRADPRRTATGEATILRPNAHPSEWAEAVGTSEATIKALRSSSSEALTPAQHGLIADFIKSKGLVADGEIALTSPEVLWAKGVEYLAKTTEPWVARGSEVAVLEAGMGRAADHLHAIRNFGAGRKEIAAAETEVERYRALLSDVRDPSVPFSAGVKYATSAEGAAMKQARKVVDARARVAAIKGVDDTVAAAQRETVGDLLHSVEQNADGTWSWIADARETSGPVFDAAVSRYKAYRWLGRPNTRTAEGLFDNQPAAFKAAEMANPKSGFVKELRKNPDQIALGSDVTQGEIADMIEAGIVAKAAATEITQGMMEALGTATREEFIAKLGSLRAARDAALDGSMLHVVERAANAKAEAWAVKRVREGGVARVWPNPEAEMAHNNALNDLAGALDNQFGAVRGIVEADPQLRAAVAELAESHAGGVGGWNLGDFLTNPANKEAIRSVLPKVLPERWTFGNPMSDGTPLGEAILKSEPGALDALAINLEAIRGRIKEPVRNVPADVVDALAREPRVSVRLTDDLNAAGIAWNTRIPEVLWAKSASGAQALSVILTGKFHQPPKTITSLLSTLKEIENGNAAHMGMGPQLAAEAQRLGQEVVTAMIGDARKAGIEIGVLGMGKMLNPYTWTADTWTMIRDLYAQNKANGGGLLMFRDELGLQYGLKQRPKGAVAVDMSSVPGLSEELLTGYFKPWNERLISARTQQAFSRLFHLDNQQITFEARGRFETALAKVGLPAQAAEKIWTAWRNAAKASRETKTVLNAAGRRAQRPGNSAMYATEKNIPNWKLEEIADDALAAYYAKAGGVPESIRQLPASFFSDEMRTAGSFTRRQLGGLADKGVPLAHFLERTYGTIAHNEWVTTRYFQFRFAMDTRLHAMNKAEGPALHGGRSGLKTAEIDKGMFGLDKEAVMRGQSGEAMLDTGYPFSATRDEWMYRTILKEQPDALRGIVKADPKLIEKAVLETARLDPELSATIAHMGHTPNEYLTILNREWGKIMRSADPEAVIDATLTRELVNSPELAEVFGRIAQVNKELIDSARQTFYGNPSRGQAERFLNSYLLYWPISYQIKASKWLLKVLYGKVGGVQTGGVGAYALDQIQHDHEDRLVSDPEYAQWFEDNPTLVFAAQMMLPITPGSMGVSLSPPIRDLFGEGKGIGYIGPVYTITKFLPQLYGDLYPTVKDFLGAGVADIPSRMLGQKPPKPKKPAVTPWDAPLAP